MFRVHTQRDPHTRYDYTKNTCTRYWTRKAHKGCLHKGLLHKGYYTKG